MLLAVNIGNTNTVCGLFKGPALEKKDIVATADARDSGFCIRFLTRVLPDIASRGGAPGIAIASVVPNALAAMRQACREIGSNDPLVVSPDVPLGITIGYESPETLGADRIVNAAAAFEKWRQALIVIDAGTATTFDYVSSDGVYAGGAIAPGITMLRDALSSGTAQLPAVAIAWNGKAIGRTTIECLQSGIVAGYISMVDGLIGRIEEEAGCKAMAIATGGCGGLLSESSGRIESYEPDLTLEGLRMIYERNR